MKYENLIPKVVYVFNLLCLYVKTYCLNNEVYNKKICLTIFKTMMLFPYTYIDIHNYLHLCMQLLI